MRMAFPRSGEVHLSTDANAIRTTLARATNRRCTGALMVVTENHRRHKANRAIDAACDPRLYSAASRSSAALFSTQ
jgi:hypothetical protein